MITLNSTSELIRVITGSALSIDVTTDYLDITSSGATIPNSINDLNISTATTTTIIAAPASSTQRKVYGMRFHNNGVSTQTLTIQRYNGTTAYTIFYCDGLQANYTLLFDDATGWTLFNDAGTSLSSTVGVTSVALTAPSILSVSGSPITTTGTLALSLTTQTANYVWAGPTSGAAATPTFRALVAGDIPSLSYVTSVAISGSSGISVSGSPITSSGTITLSLGAITPSSITTGALTFSGANANSFIYLNSGGSVYDTGSATNGQLLIGSTGNAPVAATLTAGSGISITNGAGSITIAATNTGTVTSVAMTVPSFLSVTGSPITSSGTLALTLSGTALPIANGGTGQTTASSAFNALSPITTTGDIIYSSSGTTNARLAIGTAGQVLMTNSGATAPAWTGLKFTVTVQTQAGDNNTYYYTLAAYFPFTIDKAYYQTTAGTITANVKIGTTSVTGLSALSLTSTLSNTSSTGANSVSTGNLVSVTFSSNSSATYPTVTLQCTRTG